MKMMAFKITSQNIEQAFGIQVTFIREIKPEKERFLQKKHFDFCVHFKPLFKMEMCLICHYYRTGKDAFKINSQNIKQNAGIQVTFISEIKRRLEHFLAKY